MTAFSKPSNGTYDYFVKSLAPSRDLFLSKLDATSSNGALFCARSPILRLSHFSAPPPACAHDLLRLLSDDYEDKEESLKAVISNLDNVSIQILLLDFILFCCFMVQNHIAYYAGLICPQIKFEICCTDFYDMGIVALFGPRFQKLFSKFPDFSLRPLSLRLFKTHRFLCSLRRKLLQCDKFDTGCFIV
ncbi:hypothetical protein Tcan_08057 [Toxocara canis]|uniref:Uncharacterized protein n=1 Tax=Toxocara canis TaxID=6265 RepID=A0A0B2VBG7_TOXCA|nr:hypothetical protein Tcan_08057 [Toxocara canis]